VSKIRDLNTLVGMIDRGLLIREGNEKLADVLETLTALSAEQPKKKVKGKVTLEVDIEVVNGVATISARVKAKKPEPERGTSLFWLTSDGQLTTEHPQQISMFPRDTGEKSEAAHA
jgi:hypothetical protein